MKIRSLIIKNTTLNGESIPNGYESLSQDDCTGLNDDKRGDLIPDKTHKTELSEKLISSDKHEMKILYQFRTNQTDLLDNKPKYTKNTTQHDRDKSWVSEKLTMEFLVDKNHQNVEHTSIDPIYLEAAKTSAEDLESKNTISNAESDDDYESSEDESNMTFQRSTSFRRSIVIEDEVGEKRKKSGVCVSVFFTPISPSKGEEIGESGGNYCSTLKAILNYLDNMTVSEENFGKIFESVKRLHSIFWELKDQGDKIDNNGECFSSVLDYLVVQEWPKIIVGCLRKLKLASPHGIPRSKQSRCKLFLSVFQS